MRLLSRRGGAQRRAAAFFVAAAIVGLPAGAMRVLCVGDACEVQAEASSSTPFCSLPKDVRQLVERGYYEGRSPEIVAVTGSTLVAGGDAFRGDAFAPLWPSTTLPDSGRVPVVFAGTGVTPGAAIPAGIELDDVSETIAAIIGLRRPHPQVRSGEAAEDMVSGEVPRLVLEIVWKGVGSDALERRPAEWPQLSALMRTGAGTMHGLVGSLPVDPAATLATIGTGAMPSAHGITGTVMRPDRTTYEFGEVKTKRGNKVVGAWQGRAPSNVIATLGDHLDQKRKQKPKIGLVGTDPSDRGLIGGTWYPRGDRDAVTIVGSAATVGDQVDAARRLLSRGQFGRDDVTDLAGVVLSGPVPDLDAALNRLVKLAERLSRDSAAVVVTATGPSESGPLSLAIDADVLRRKLERAISGSEPVIEALVPGGLYVDQSALARLKMSDDVVLRELLRMQDHAGERLMADAFAGIAITFGRYC